MYKKILFLAGITIFTVNLEAGQYMPGYTNQNILTLQNAIARANADAQTAHQAAVVATTAAGPNALRTAQVARERIKGFLSRILEISAQFPNVLNAQIASAKISYAAANDAVMKLQNSNSLGTAPGYINRGYTDQNMLTQQDAIARANTDAQAAHQAAVAATTAFGPTALRTAQAARERIKALLSRILRTSAQFPNVLNAQIASAKISYAAANDAVIKLQSNGRLGAASMPTLGNNPNLGSASLDGLNIEIGALRGSYRTTLTRNLVAVINGAYVNNGSAQYAIERLIRSQNWPSSIRVADLIALRQIIRGQNVTIPLVAGLSLLIPGGYTPSAPLPAKLFIPKYLLA